MTFLTSLLFCAAAATRASDWPQWRGPHRDAVWAEAVEFPSFPPSPPAVLWRFPVDRGFSSPVVADGRVFVTDAVLAEPRVLERVHCLDAASGEVCWKKNLRQAYQLKDMPTDPSPLMDGDRLIVFVGGRPGAAVVAFNPQSGEELWRALDEALTHSSPIVLRAGGLRQLIVWTHDSVSSLAPESGRILWSEPMVTSADEAVATPVFDAGYLLIGGLMMKFEEGAPRVMWPETRTVSRRVLSNTSAPLLQGGHVYSARSSGALVCLEAGTGAQLWATNGITDALSGASIHLTAGGDTSFLFTNQGELIQARLTAAGYREMSRALLIQPTWPFAGRNVAWAAPAFAHGRVYARNDEELVCASLRHH